MNKQICHITRKEFSEDEGMNAHVLRPELFKLIRKDYPDFGKESFISNGKLDEYRKKYLEGLITQEKHELSKLEKEVLDSITHNKLLSESIESQHPEKPNLGQRLADHIASFGGSWTFILIFFSFLAIWMAINSWVLLTKPFDPFPFILLNLILSCIAAIQAPIIMMSQNRQEAKDRQRAEHDYKINLKAELEIKLLHEKLDHLMIHQNKRLLEIQEIQADYLEEIISQLKPKNGPAGDGHGNVSSG